MREAVLSCCFMQRLLYELNFVFKSYFCCSTHVLEMSLKLSWVHNNLYCTKLAPSVQSSRETCCTCHEGTIYVHRCHCCYLFGGVDAARYFDCSVQCCELQFLMSSRSRADQYYASCFFKFKLYVCHSMFEGMHSSTAFSDA